MPAFQRYLQLSRYSPAGFSTSSPSEVSGASEASGASCTARVSSAFGASSTFGVAGAFFPFRVVAAGAVSSSFFSATPA